MLKRKLKIGKESDQGGLQTNAHGKIEMKDDKNHCKRAGQQVRKTCD